MVEGSFAGLFRNRKGGPQFLGEPVFDGEDGNLVVSGS